VEKLFDLNIGEVLEAWDVEHALREVIANALDEQILSKTKDIKIFCDTNDLWHIRDYGRGLQENHFKQDENPEKTQASNLIGKFGVGLKDALAVFHRKSIEVKILSRHLTATLAMHTKTGFSGIETLHAIITAPQDKAMQGTDFILRGVTEKDIAKAKAMFLCFSGLKPLEKTRYGEAYENHSSHAESCVYINGIRVALENNFMFSYNITNITSAIKKALNRERSNVGRTAYTDSVKKILLNCRAESILKALVSDLQNISCGKNKDESSWLDISCYAAKELNKTGTVVFVSPYERSEMTNMQVEILNQSGKTLMLVPDSVREKLGNSVNTFCDIMKQYHKSFQYEFIDYQELTATEKQIFDMSTVVISFLKRHNAYKDVPIKISETIRVDESGQSTNGVYTGSEIIVKRSKLKRKEVFLGVLEHEFAHAYEGHKDNTRDFENTLTKFCGWHLADLI
jgi:hypothetical protein